MKLALALGMSLSRAQEEIDSEEFSWWMAFDRLHPIDGIERLELMIASLTCLTANLNRKKNRAPFKHSTFMPNYYAGHQVIQRGETMFAILKAFTKKAEGEMK